MVGESRRPQLEALKEGFFSIPFLQKTIQQEKRIETARELAMICCGDEVISSSHLKQLIIFNNYPPTEQQHLLHLIDHWASDQLEKLRLFVEFVTGLYSLPERSVHNSVCWLLPFACEDFESDRGNEIGYNGLEEALNIFKPQKC